MRQCTDLGLLNSDDDLLGDFRSQTEFQPDAEMLDARLSEATLAAVSNFSVTPLIKEELRCCIQAKRLAKGEDVIEVDTRTPESDQLTLEDMERRKQRRDRNKDAAQKCRARKRQRCESLTIEEKLLQKKFDDLTEDVKKLTTEKEDLELYIRAHKQFCSMAFLTEDDMEQSRDIVACGGEGSAGSVESSTGEGESFVGEGESFARDDVLLIEDDDIANDNLLICEEETSLVEEIISFEDEVVIDDSLEIYGNENIASFGCETIACFGSETIAGFGSETIAGFDSDMIASFGSDTIAGCLHETTG